MIAARGEVETVIAGQPVRLCLTLGALAEIEAALQAEGVEALAERLRCMRAADLEAVLTALIGGGGGGGAEPDAARRLARACEPRAAAEAVTRAFEAAAR